METRAPTENVQSATAIIETTDNVNPALFEKSHDGNSMFDNAVVTNKYVFYSLPSFLMLSISASLNSLEGTRA